MTRRGYPILGPRKLRLFDATKLASKPGYLRLEILRGQSQDQLEASPRSRPGPEPGPDPGPEPGPDP